MKFKKIIIVLMVLMMVLSVCAYANNDNNGQHENKTVDAKWYIHLVEDGNVDIETWGSKPQDSSNYFPLPENTLIKEIIKPKIKDATNKADDDS